jgi:peptidoglycan/xylan/chitin deacetylase (PgdA/CDA1 family)
MNWDIWGRIEETLLRYNISPILAVIPDNRDPQLEIAPPAPDFWDRVRSWQARGWAIGLHGHQHVYVNLNRGLIGVTPRSEFAGVDPEIQEAKLRKGLDIFTHEGVRPDCWIAPAHSFDWNTVDLLVKLGLPVISDGLWRWPHTDKRGVTWVPQQLWNHLRPMPPGIWTVCNHHNHWTEHEILSLEQQVRAFASLLIAFDDAVSSGKQRKLALSDTIRAKVRPLKYRLRPFLAPLLALRKP